MPIVAITTNTLPGDRERYSEGGIDGCFAKPFRISELMKAIDAAVRAGHA